MLELEKYVFDPTTFIRFDSQVYYPPLLVE